MVNTFICPTHPRSLLCMSTHPICVTVIEPEKLCGRYRRSNDVTSARIHGSIRCGVICDRTAECDAYKVDVSGGCVLLESACTDGDTTLCYNRLCN